ncbi:MAG: hypothetical protein K2L39_04400 [Muribaculaceae bacterium]|nr:hypothetical protein [Muribaculaceae bacterium]
MKKGFLSYFPLAMLMAYGAVVSGCNSSETWGTDPQDLSGTAVTAFSLKSDQKVLNNLDSVFFSIDLVAGKIFNASPLPYGTNVDAIAVSISSDACSVAQLLISGNEAEEKEASVVDYLTSPDEKIDFSNGPVTLHLVSADGQHERDYEIRVNVASEVADSLYWDKLQAGTLRGVAGMSRSKTVKYGDKALTLSTAADGSVGIASFIPNATSGGGNWEADVLTPSFIDANTASVGNLLNVESFTATEDGILFIADSYGNLHRSTDGGQTFGIVDNGWENITAPYRNAILGVKENAGSRTLAAYPPSAWSLSGEALPSGFPVNATSEAAVFSTKWATLPQIVIAGGKTANGTPTGSAWAFDGKQWAKISDRLPAASGYSMTKYTVAETDTISWRVRQREVLIAFGGMGLKPVSDVWISRDMGVNWQKGSETLQLPEYIPFTTGASLLVFEKTLDADAAAPLAITPITSWECPYLYLFGGYDVAGKLHSTYWSGVVNHLRMKPLQ